jgi:hypothetical protein
VWWYTAIISALGRLRPEDGKFKTILDYTVPQTTTTTQIHQQLKNKRKRTVYAGSYL